MGSCISKCKPKKTSNKHQTQQEECKCKCVEKDSVTTITPLVQDKLVISQGEAPLPPSSSPPKSSSSSAYSVCTTSNYPTTSSSSTSSCSLLSSASSLASSMSTQSSKLDQSFSNEFLWSCVKENPQLLNEDFPIKVLNHKRNSLPIRCQTNGKKPNRPKELPAPSPQWVVHRSASQKRPRCNNSPSNLTRQKSFRREPDAEPNRPISRSGRDLRPMSPSSSRRFNGEANSQGRIMTSSMRRENYYVRPQSPNKNYNKNNKIINNNTNNNNLRKYSGSINKLVKREDENVKKEVSSKIEELGVGNLVSNQDVDMMPIEDVNNPHIALDCFIFL